MAEYNPKSTKGYRKELRIHLTPAEASLWKLLKNKQLNGCKFRRQHGVGPYILDFYCPALKIAIELDGKPHFTDAGNARDHTRDEYLTRLGIVTLRFENNILYTHQEMIIDAIEECIKSKKQPPRPSGTPPCEGGE